jgi:hypothetical protein
MANHRSSADGARVLADLNTLRGIGAYKTGVHKPTFSEAHMRSLQWLAGKLPEAGLAAEIDGIGNVLGTSAKPGPKLLAGSHLESQNYAGWLDGPLGIDKQASRRLDGPNREIRGRHPFFAVSVVPRSTSPRRKSRGVGRCPRTLLGRSSHVRYRRPSRRGG